MSLKQQIRDTKTVFIVRNTTKPVQLQICVTVTFDGLQSLEIREEQVLDPISNPSSVSRWRLDALNSRKAGLYSLG